MPHPTDSNKPSTEAPEDTQAKVWLITGSSRGLGRALAEAVLAKGDQLVATARDPSVLADLKARYRDRILTFALDVTNAEQARAAVAATVSTFGRLDVLVNNAGYGFMGAVEEQSEAEFADQIDTNFWGTVHITRAALPVLRRQRAGHIIQITSIGGRVANAGLAGYQAAKFAVEGFSEALAAELKPLGVQLTIVEPGGFRTDWGTASMAFAEPIADYDASVGMLSRYLRAQGALSPGDPVKAAAVILELTGMQDAPLRLPLGNDALVLLSHAYQHSLDELARWAHLTRATDFDGLDISAKDHILLAMTKQP